MAVSACRATVHTSGCTITWILSPAFCFFCGWPPALLRLNAYKRCSLYPWVRIRPLAMHRGVSQVIKDCEEHLHSSLSRTPSNKRWLEEPLVLNAGLEWTEFVKVRGSTEIHVPQHHHANALRICVKGKPSNKKTKTKKNISTNSCHCKMVANTPQNMWHG